MYLSKHTEHVNPVLLLMTVIHIIGILSVKNILQEKIFSLCIYVLLFSGVFFSKNTLCTFHTCHVQVPSDDKNNAFAGL